MIKSILQKTFLSEPGVKSVSKLVLVICLVFSSNLLADPEQARPGFSSFGLGFNSIDYEENSARVIAGRRVDVETDSIVNIAQQSGTYVSFNNDWGFYLFSSSTLGETKTEESWEIDEIPIRTNKVSFEQQRIAFLLSRRINQDRHLLFGAQYNNTEFRRFGARLTPSASQFNVTQEMLNTGTESETAFDITFSLGFEITSLFVKPEPGWRYQIRGVLGLPVFTNISNTEVNDGESFKDGFNGFSGQLNFVYGYQFNANLFAAFFMDLALSKRNAIDRPTSDEFGITEFPENTLVYFYPGLALYWSF
ncbi:MAG: hypothetical protein KTR32_31305 [Granulosicoccus sp.]|nr:hypothetical protein [Granulosicoccus sp.]